MGVGGWKVVNIHKDHWLRGKHDICVGENHLSITSTDKLCQFICFNTKEWDEEKVRQTFSSSHMAAILETRILQSTITNKIGLDPNEGW